MPRHTSVRIVAAGFVTLMLAACVSPRPGAGGDSAAPPPIDVPISELGSRYRLIGTLGRPLGPW